MSKPRGRIKNIPTHPCCLSAPWAAAKKKHPVSYTFFACANNKFPSHAQLLAPCSLGVNPQHPIYSRLLRTLSSSRSLSFRRSFISTGVKEATEEGVIALIITCVCSTFWHTRPLVLFPPSLRTVPLAAEAPFLTALKQLEDSLKCNCKLLLFFVLERALIRS